MALAPENSAVSFLLAEAAGVEEIELDVRVTADGGLSSFTIQPLSGWQREG